MGKAESQSNYQELGVGGLTHSGTKLSLTTAGTAANDKFSFMGKHICPQKVCFVLGCGE